MFYLIYTIRKGCLKLKKAYVLIISIILILLISGCTTDKDNLEWHSTKEEAIERGLLAEGANLDAILSIEVVNDETIIFYEYQQSLGVASLSESEKGYSWYQTQPYTDFDSAEPYAVASYDFETKKGNKVSVLTGKAFDPNIEKIILTGDGPDRELEISDNSRIFYSTHEVPYNLLKISPVEES